MVKRQKTEKEDVSKSWAYQLSPPPQCAPLPRIPKGLMNKQVADLILYNANVLTMNRRQPRAGLVAVKDGRIVRVGGNDDLDLF